VWVDADRGGDEKRFLINWLGRFRDHPRLVPVVKDLVERPVRKDDPGCELRKLRDWTESAGWAGVRGRQAELWGDFFSKGWIELPDAPDAQAIWETSMYILRTQFTRWSMPVMIHGDIFGGMYFPDEMAAMRALLQTGHWDLARRLCEHKLSVLPMGMQMVDAAGARGDAATCEGGHFSVSPMGCSVYEVHASGEPPRLIWCWLQYAGTQEDLERYYPIFWGTAEFFRRWMVYQGPDGRYFTGSCVDFNESVLAVRNGAATRASASGSMLLAAEVAVNPGISGAMNTQVAMPAWLAAVNRSRRCAGLAARGSSHRARSLFRWVSTQYTSITGAWQQTSFINVLSRLTMIA